MGLVCGSSGKHCAIRHCQWRLLHHVHDRRQIADNDDTRAAVTAIAASRTAGTGTGIGCRVGGAACISTSGATAGAAGTG
ncbi:MAG: hypothetical protein CMQ34_00490 [Gammaproteobacteria bacterium]|nr:hypothetical protein [Gammaproteobacteria bacterium]